MMLSTLKADLRSALRANTNLKNGLKRLQAAWRRIERIKSGLAMRSLPYIKIADLNRYEAKIYSQNGEDGILQAIFRKIGVTNKYFVEFGVEDAQECNTRYLREKQGWDGLWMDGQEHHDRRIQKEFVTADNINGLFQKYHVPAAFDLLSIDIDGNDYWVWKALDSSYKPRVVVIEYNSKIPPTESKVISYDPDFHWDGTDYFGASLLALVRLASVKGYVLVGCDRRGINAFFIQKDLAETSFVPRDYRALYRKPGYCDASGNPGWPSGAKDMISI